MTELITRAEAARMLTVSEDTVDRLIKSSMLPAYRVSARIVRLDRADVLAYLEGRQQRASALQNGRRKSRSRGEPVRGGVNNSGYYPGMKVV